MPRRESWGQTILVAVLLCVICSLLVSGAAVSLKPYQELNKKLDRQKNVIDATGMARNELGKSAQELTRSEINTLYERIQPAVVELGTGALRPDIDPDEYDQRKAAKDPEQNADILDPDFDIGIKKREQLSQVFFVLDEKTKSEITQVVLPVYGKGLWSTLYGYLAVGTDGKTIKGLTFYEHAETPGLGGEVENPQWKAQWQGRWLYDDQDRPAAGVSKGPAPDDSKYLVDGLSGATITSTGVTNLVRYWSGEDAYKPLLEKLAAGEIEIDTTEQNDG